MLYFRLMIIIVLLISSVKNDLNQLMSFLGNSQAKEWLRNITTKSGSSNPYCQICCMDISSNGIGKLCGHHTMCIFKENKTGPNCSGYINIEFSKIEKLAIVVVHNTLRNLVAGGFEKRGSPGPQPTASNMRTMEWDEELATVAHRWAQQCLFVNDFCRDLERFPVGQNIAKGKFTRSEVILLIKEWFDNVQYLNEDIIKSYKVPEYENEEHIPPYTQIVWADTYKIGCARAVFQQHISDHVKYEEHFICNYGPTGNIPNQPVYKVGEPCTYCPVGTICTSEYSNLCGNALKWTPKKHLKKVVPFLEKSVEIRNAGDRTMSVKVLNKIVLTFLLLCDVIHLAK